MAAWRWLACDMKTGRLLAELPLGASGTGNGTFWLPLTDATPEEWWQATLPARTVIVGELDDQVAWAGIVWTRRLTDQPVVELGCHTVESYLSQRWVDWTIGPLENLDQHRAARALVAHANTSGVDLQIDAQPLSGIRRAPLVYQRWADQRIGDQLDALHQLPNGIEWTIDTTWTSHSRLGRRLVHTVRIRTGAGRSFAADIPAESMTLRQFVVDALELIDWLTARFAQERVYSSGTVGQPGRRDAGQ